MPRGPSSNPIVKRIPWQQRPTCAECGLKIRRPRPGDEKVCSRCHELLHVSEFPHNSARADHRETYCRPCKRVRQNEGNRRIRGAAQPLSDLSPVGEETTTLIGTFVSQAPLTEYREVPSSVKPVQVQYETVDRKPVYELTLKPTHRPAGTAADNIAIVHTFTELAAAPLEAGQWLACVLQDGQLEKVLRAGDSGRSSIRASSSPRTKTPRWCEVRQLRTGPSVEPRTGRGVHPQAKPRSSSSVRRPSRGW